MPYELEVVKRVRAKDPERYFNDCCYGGDAFVDLLLPEIRKRYEKIQSNQEDWGWFIWFCKGPISMAVDIFCDDGEKGQYRIHLIARKKKGWFGTAVADGSELEELRSLVVGLLDPWAESPCKVSSIDRD